MASNLSLEAVPMEAGAVCACCGTRSLTAHGFVYEAGDALAVYYAGWTLGHPERGVTLAIATGEWGEEAGPVDRVSIGLVARATESQIQFSVLEPTESPWGETSLLGKMLGRATALGHARLAKTYEIAELVVREDPGVQAFLQASGA